MPHRARWYRRARVQGRRFTGLGEIAIALTTLGALAAFAAALVRRVFFPWPLEWMEGVVLEHVVRLLDGAPIYAAPSADFVPLLYPPVSYAAMAPFVAVFGKSLAAARLGSVAATLVTFAVSATAAARLAPAHRGWAAVLAVGLLALGHGYGGTFYDLCRVDAVALALLAGGVALVGDGTRRGRAIAGFVLLAVATLAKQQSAAVLGALALLSLRRPALQVPAIAGIGALVALVALGQAWTGGWLWTLCVSVPRGHAVHFGILPVALLVDLLFPLPILCIAWGADFVRARRALDPAHAALLGGLAAALLSRAHEGAFDNVLLTGYVLGAPVAAATLARGLCDPAAATRRRAILAGALLAQAAILYTPPAAISPAPADAAAFRDARHALRRCAGRGKASVALDHAGLGSAPFAHTMAISDVLQGGRYALRDRTARTVARGLDPEWIGAVGVGDATFPALDEVLQARYLPCTMVPALPVRIGHDPGAILIWRARSAVEDPVALGLRGAARAWYTRAR